MEKGRKERRKAGRDQTGRVGKQEKVAVPEWLNDIPTLK